MPLTRWIISVRDDVSSPIKDAIVNTLYFNVSGSVDEPDYDSLGNDLWTIWAGRPWAIGRYMDIRAYNMDDAKPRPQKFIRVGQVTGTRTGGVRQVALCLSYYADRNLPRQRGRIYLGPFTTTEAIPPTSHVTAVMALPPLLAGLGGVNVDWSLYSPTNGTHTRINHAWCDNSWDIIRARKLAPTIPRATWTGNG